MTTANETILAHQIDGHDEDGKPESFELSITLIGDGYTLEILQDGDSIDSITFTTLAEAQDAASDKADAIRKQDKQIALERLRAADECIREALCGIAEEMTADAAAAAAVKLLALLVGAGRGAAALTALRRIAFQVK